MNLGINTKYRCAEKGSKQPHNTVNIADTPTRQPNILLSAGGSFHRRARDLVG